MRLALLAMTVAGAVALAGAAAAQSHGNYDGIAVNAPSGSDVQSNYVGQSYGGPASDNTDRRQRYLQRIHSLHEWLLKLKAEDGGELSAEHTAILQRQLDKLNRIYGMG